MNQIWPAESRTVNPGVTPSFFAAMTVQFPGAGPLTVSGPFRSSSTVMARVPRRFVNQFESGTSSTVFTFCARTFGVLSPGQATEFSSVSIDQIDVTLFHLGGVLRVLDSRNGIVGVELRRRGTGPNRHRERHAGSDLPHTRARDPSRCDSHGQKLPAAPTIRRALCSSLRATSTRNA